ncbi:hypothetical protein L195_g047308 [Trifolium pratense]|uniref:Uncharacterized protein n=1 Tax=Trifolium pratense TaxID=57577 RepID=A0A2K3MK59_TRIPR|nr:hypothetical protein L195_g047308 [Trifolium pratense]
MVNFSQDWSWDWQREFNQEDLVSAADMLEILAGVQMRDSETDVVSWSPDFCSQSSVQSCYLTPHNLLSEFDFVADFVAAVQHVWNTLIPSKSACSGGYCFKIYNQHL